MTAPLSHDLTASKYTWWIRASTKERGKDKHSHHSITMEMENKRKETDLGEKVEFTLDQDEKVAIGKWFFPISINVIHLALLFFPLLTQSLGR